MENLRCLFQADKYRNCSHAFAIGNMFSCFPQSSIIAKSQSEHCSILLCFAQLQKQTNLVFILLNFTFFCEMYAYSENNLEAYFL